MSFRIPHPDNEVAFEQLCTRFLQTLWNCDNIRRYGKRGEEQDGIDLIDESGSKPFRAAQCKNHEPDKTIPPKEIQDEIDKALAADIKIDEYYILTTARKSKQAQTHIVNVNRKHKETGKFSVHLWTWADIEEKLSQLDEVTFDWILRGDTGRSIPALYRTLDMIVVNGYGLVPSQSPSALDAELESITGALSSHNLDVAAHQIKQLESRARAILTPEQRYQLKILQFRISAAKWDWKEAAALLFDAKQHLPTTERARINEVFAYELKGEVETAHALATILREEFPESVRLLTIWIRTAPVSTSLGFLDAKANRFIPHDEELNLALAQRAAVEGKYTNAIRYAARASKIDSTSPQAWFILAQIKHSASLVVSPGNMRRRLQQADDHYGRAIDLAREQRMPGLEASARFGRGAVRCLLGSAAAEVDYVTAVDLARPDQGLRLKYVTYLLECERYCDALRELAKEPAKPDVERLFYEAAARHGRNEGDDRDVAVALMKDVLTCSDCTRWPDAHILLVQWFIDGKRYSEARGIIEDTELRRKQPVVYHTLSGWILQSERHADAAKAKYRDALSAMNDSSPREYVFLLGQGLTSVGDDGLALPLLERCYRPGVFNAECRRLLDCARRLKRHDVSLRVCRDLRLAGATDPRLIHTEVELLSLYDPGEGLRVAAEHLKRHPDDRVLMLWQSLLAWRLGEPSRIIADIARFPEPDELTSAGCCLVVNLLEEDNQADASVTYAYNMLRAHFDDEVAHAMYVATVTRSILNRSVNYRTADKVEAGMAIRFRLNHSNLDRWVIIEDDRDPELSRDEFGPNHPVCQVLLGHSVGDTVVIVEGEVQEQNGTIIEIVDKRILRFKECRDKYQQRFPGKTAIQMVHVGSGEEFDPSPIIKKMEQWRTFIEWLDEQYRTGPVPLVAYAEITGRRDFAVWDHLVSKRELGIHCFAGGKGEAETALSLAAEAGNFVLDLPCLITLWQLGMGNVLGYRSRLCVVSQSTFEWLQHIVAGAKEEMLSGGDVVFSQGGKLRAGVVTPEQRKRHFEVVSGLRDAVREHCEIRPCPEAAELEPDRRERLVRVLRRHTVDTLLLASKVDTLLWTDDHVVGEIGRTEFQTVRVWTQPMLRMFLSEKLLTADEYHRAVAKLVGWHYAGVDANWDTLVAAGEVAGWEVSSWPLPTVMQSVLGDNVPFADRVRIALNVIRSVWRRPLPDQVRHDFLFAMLGVLGSEKLIRRLLREVPERFGIDVVVAKEVQECILFWMRQGRRVLRP